MIVPKDADYYRALLRDAVANAEPTSPFIHLVGCISTQKYGLPRSFDGQEYCIFCDPCNQAWNAALDAAREAVMLHATAGQGAAVPPREFVHTDSLLASIDAMRDKS